MNRRKFIKSGSIASAALAVGLQPLSSFADTGVAKLTILHTNDVHSRIEPFPMDGGRYQGLGGFARRAALIKQIRAQESNVLLLDAGDIFQGTPYFNLFGGELEFKLMSEMGYDAATFGNHDFDNGIEGLVKQMPFAQFQFLISNYDLKNTALQNLAKPYKIFKKQGLKIGVFGVGIKLEGLVEKKNYGEIQYLNPIDSANYYATLLKQEEKCDLVICLSHLGYSYNYNQVSDKVLASSTEHIDLIIGGHTHTFLPKPEDVKNKSGAITTINQVGYAGINLGRVDYFFEKNKGKRRLNGALYEISDQIG
ncbi:bifunctional metallophosphatase/5'-nucleotidase [Pedobacter flavus]|uniref:Metallophosphatase n=1 Tax=Pedobacter flavus TaxID=3113906 RepID=A0ABU7H2X3_9SPHI|nr:metallophosphatase [Pedobacter sp. VNH31]MEE1885591.1 metallophosphatase [Pedobacter sp. VNH31]